MPGAIINIIHTIDLRSIVVGNDEDHSLLLAKAMHTGSELSYRHSVLQTFDSLNAQQIQDQPDCPSRCCTESQTASFQLRGLSVVDGTCSIKLHRHGKSEKS
jgi:hypothetical protein